MRSASGDTSTSLSVGIFSAAGSASRSMPWTGAPCCCALATWAWKGRQYAVQVRPGEDGLILQQLLYASEVRSATELGIEHVDVQKSELQLALQLAVLLLQAPHVRARGCEGGAQLRHLCEGLAGLRHT